MSLKYHTIKIVPRLLLVLIGMIFNSGLIYSMELLELKSNSFIEDTIPPTAFCKSGIISIPLTTCGCITIEARKFDLGSIDDVTPQNKLKFYFNGDKNKDSIQICCEDLLASGNCDEMSLDLQLWVEDECGNTDSCLVHLKIQDIMDICCCLGSYYSISGSLRTLLSENVTATISLKGDNNFYKRYVGNQIYFGELTNGNFQLCIEKNDKSINGVSTADIVKIKRHILGIELFNSPYKILAADVNRSGSILATDLSEIRRAIFGIIDTFNYVPSWIFIPADYKFPENKFPDVNLFIPTCIDITIKDQNVRDLRLIAVKMGDVTLDANGE